MENSIQVSTNAALSARLTSLLEATEAAARQNFQVALENNGGLTDLTVTERRAIIKLEQLKAISGLSLAEILLRGEVIRDIEREGLWSTHPQGYASMEEAAADQGISQSEYSNIRDLCDVVFPYLTEVGYNIPELWETIGKSKFRELVPVLKRAILNEESRSARTEQVFQNEMNDIFATARATGEEISDEEARTILVEQLIEAGELPVRELRQRIRPERTESMVGWRIPFTPNENLVVFVVNQDQQELLNRRLSGYVDVSPVSRGDAQRSPLLNNISSFLRGE